MALVTMRSGRVLLAAAATTGLLATACDGGAGSSPAADPPTTGPPASVVATPRPTASPSPTRAPVSRPTYTPTYTPRGPLRVTRAMTSPGARLRFGQKAIVPVRAYNDYTKTYTDGVVGVTVMRIRRTPASRLEGNFDAKSEAVLRRSTAYYAPVLITNEGGTDLDLVSPSLEGRRRGGREPDVALIGGEVPGCPGESSPDGFGRKGARWLTCALAVSSASRPVTSFSWTEPPYGLEIHLFKDSPRPYPAPKFNQYYDLGAITWH